MKDIIGVERIRVGDVWYTEEDIQSLPLENLEDLKLKVNSLVIDISSKISEKLTVNPDLLKKVAQSKARWVAGDNAKVEPDSSEESDLAWYVNAKHALNLFQRALPYLTSVVKRRRSLERPFSSYFMDVAREMLSKEKFDELSAEARFRHQANQAK